MSHMIELLKNAQTDLESNATLSQEEIVKLAAQNEGKSKELFLLEIANSEEKKRLRQTKVQPQPRSWSFRRRGKVHLQKTILIVRNVPWRRMHSRSDAKSEN
jgi:hypothetical protein